MAVFTEPFPRIDSGRADPSKDIFPDGDGFQVGGVDAVPHTAQMIEAQALRDRPYQCLIGDTMGHGPPKRVGVFRHDLWAHIDAHLRAGILDVVKRDNACLVTPRCADGARASIRGHGSRGRSGVLTLRARFLVRLDLVHIP